MHKIVLAITGASGSIYAKLLIEKLLTIKDQWQELAIVMTENAKQVWKTELGNEELQKLSDLKFIHTRIYAPFASGSGQFNMHDHCSLLNGTLGRIASGISNDLITRAADVVLKERRKLICVIQGYSL